MIKALKTTDAFCFMPADSRTPGAASNASDASFNPEKSRSRLKEWFPELSDSTLGHLLIYLAELNKFNKAVNLVSPQTLQNADAVHIADAVYAFKYIKPKLVPQMPLFDFGSGNGIPGLIFGLLDPSLKVTLVDRDERKLEFCKHVAATCKASNITTLKPKSRSFRSIRF